MSAQPKSFAAHMQFPLREYDRRIRSFIPDYEELLGTAAQTLGILSARRPRLVDLGTGTGALAQACRRVRPDATLVGIDADPGMVAAAGRRLRRYPDCRLSAGDFTDRIPRGDVITGALAFHHIPTERQKRLFYRRCFDALPPGGFLVSADCMPPVDPDLRARAEAAWRRHMQRTYTARETRSLLDAWADEDTYFPLEAELRMMTAARLRPDVVWRRGMFAVVVARKA